MKKNVEVNKIYNLDARFARSHCFRRVNSHKAFEIGRPEKDEKTSKNLRCANIGPARHNTFEKKAQLAQHLRFEQRRKHLNKY